MEEKKFTVRIKGPNSKDRIVQDWMVEANNRMRLAGQLAYAKDEGIIEVIKAMLKKKLDYNTISEVTNKSIEEIKIIETLI